MPNYELGWEPFDFAQGGEPVEPLQILANRIRNEDEKLSQEIREAGKQTSAKQRGGSSPLNHRRVRPKK